MNYKPSFYEKAINNPPLVSADLPYKILKSRAIFYNLKAFLYIGNLFMTNLIEFFCA